jgi:hypothetical protein
MSIRLIAEAASGRALALFHTSNIYLAIVMLAVCTSTLLS